MYMYEPMGYKDIQHMSQFMGKPTICIGENKDADQLRGNREADQRLCFRYSDSRISLLLKSEISRFLLFSVLVQAGLCRTCSENTLLVFPRGGSYALSRKSKQTLLCAPPYSLEKNGYFGFTKGSDIKRHVQSQKKKCKTLKSLGKESLYYFKPKQRH